jgi:HEAT repeat protein/cyclophilin family peptidyl-prolyl cis-trans isomerase
MSAFVCHRSAARAGLLLPGLLLIVSCASAPAVQAPAAVAAPPVTIDQKIAWILRLEQQRVLQDPAAPAGPAAAPAAAGPAPASASGPDLAVLLRDPDANVRARAALAVGRVRMTAGTPLLTAALDDEAAGVRAMAAFALGLVDDADALGPLQRVLTDPALEVRTRAVEALGLIGDAAAAPAIAQAAAGCGPVLAGIEPDDEEWPKTAEIELCRQSLFALARLRHFDALAQVALDGQGRPVSRWWPVAYALQRIGDPKAAAYLRPLVPTAGVYTPAFALRGLAAAKDPETVALALPIATQPTLDPKLRVAAVRALGQVGGSAAVVPLVQLLAEPALPTNLAIEIVTALGSLGDPAAFDPLLELLTDASPAVRAAALSAAASANRDAFMLVLSGLGPDPDWSVRVALAGVLAKLPADQARPGLEALADDEDARVHGPALAALVAVDSEAAVPRLKDALGAPDFVERGTAARLIGELKPEGGVAALIEAYRRGESDATSSAREAAVTALAAYGTPEAIEAIRRALSDPDWPLRLRAAELLRGLGVRDAQPERPAPLRRPAEFFSSPELLRPAYSPHAFIETPLGTIELQLNVVEAPLTTRAFVDQARAGLFTGVRIHRVVPGFVVQAGDPRGDGEGGPGYTQRDELSSLPYLRGTLGMALAGPDTAGSQWFITLSPQPHLEANYTVFGRVVAGWDLLDRLSPWDVIERVRIWDGVELR